MSTIGTVMASTVLSQHKQLTRTSAFIKGWRLQTDRYIKEDPDVANVELTHETLERAMTVLDANMADWDERPFEIGHAPKELYVNYGREMATFCHLSKVDDPKHVVGEVADATLANWIGITPQWVDTKPLTSHEVNAAADTRLMLYVDSMCKLNDD